MVYLPPLLSTSQSPRLHTCLPPHLLYVKPSVSRSNCTAVTNAAGFFLYLRLAPTGTPLYCGSLPVVQSVFPWPSFIEYVKLAIVPLIALVILLIFVALPLPASAWNIPGHMLSGAIAHQVLQQENRPTIEKVKAVLEKHPWYANQWQARLQDVPAADRDLVL